MGTRYRATYKVGKIKDIFVPRRVFSLTVHKATPPNRIAIARKCNLAAIVRDSYLNENTNPTIIHGPRAICCYRPVRLAMQLSKL